MAQEMTGYRNDEMMEQAFDKSLPMSDIVDEIGIISEKTKLTGNIKTDGHLTICGTVTGDITAKGNVVITGSVTGNISCNNLMVEAKGLLGDIVAKGTVVVKEGKTIEGNVSCKDLTVSGIVKGNIKAEEKIGLSQTAVIEGDIKAREIAVGLGAKIKGSLEIG